MLDAATHRKQPVGRPAGNSPCLIFADADLDQAIDSALFGAFALNGQRRTATSTILAQRPVYDTVVSRLAQRAERIRVGDPADPATELGPLPHSEHYDELTSCVRLGIREGARLAAGGRRPAGLAEGNFLAPTVLADVTPSMQIFTEQVCGPVVRVTPFDTDEEAVSLANAVTDPTAAYLWTSDLERARRLAPAIGSASTWVNCRNRRTGRRGRAASPARQPARRHRLLHAVPDRADRGRRHARAAIRSLSGAANARRKEPPLRTRPRTLTTLLLAVPLALAVAACSGGGSAGPSNADAKIVNSGAEIVIGATLSLTGSLGMLGRPLEAGYQLQIADVNAAGGIAIGGAREKLKLVVLDNGSDPARPPRRRPSWCGRITRWRYSGPPPRRSSCPPRW